MKKHENIALQINGYDIDDMIERYLKEKLGDVEIVYSEFTISKLKNKHILNDDENEYTIYVDYTRE